MVNLSTDLSILTTIPKNTLDNLVDKSLWCICHTVEENLINHNEITEINIGLGTLLIKVEEGSIRYKFIPSPKLEESVRDTVVNKENPLIANVESTLASRIVNTYKDLFQ